MENQLDHIELETATVSPSHPARPTPPGNALRRELEARGWTRETLAEKLGCTVWFINGIIRGSKALTPETAIQIEKTLGTPAIIWLDLDSRWRLWLARERLTDLVFNHCRRDYRDSE